MSQEASIVEALQTHLQALTPLWPTAWPNVSFTPAPSVPHQRADVLFGRNAATGPGRSAGTRWVGQLIVRLHTNLLDGELAALERSGALRTHFNRGRSLSAGGVTVVLEEPYLGTKMPETDWYVLPVWCPWFSTTF